MLKFHARNSTDRVVQQSHARAVAPRVRASRPPCSLHAKHSCRGAGAAVSRNLWTAPTLHVGNDNERFCCKSRDGGQQGTG
jgi:hypothetical protein